MYRILLFILMLGYFGSVQAQNLTGKWVGFFTTNTGLSYPYEVIIQDDGNTNIIANTYTKFTSSYSAKASAKGMFTRQSKIVSILETKFDQITLAPNTQACLMSSYLTYNNSKGKEVLQGTYISNNFSGPSDCGSGIVMLTKEINFVFVKKNNKEVNKVVKKEDKKETQKIAVLKKDTLKQMAVKSLIVDTAKTTSTPNQIVSTTTNQTEKNTSSNLKESLIKESIIKKESESTIRKAISNKIPVPWVLISRDNKLIKSITTNAKKVSIDLYDNGSFESDSVTVYDNNVIIFDRLKLSYKEFHFELPLNEKITQHELVLVAHKTGNMTRNSSILIFKDNNIKEEFIINTNNKTNAKITIKYDAKVKPSE